MERARRTKHKRKYHIRRRNIADPFVVEASGTDDANVLSPLPNEDETFAMEELEALSSGHVQLPEENHARETDNISIDVDDEIPPFADFNMPATEGFQ